MAEGKVIDIRKGSGDLKPPPNMGGTFGMPLGVFMGASRRVFQGQENWLVESNPALIRPQLYRTLQRMRELIPIVSTYTHIFNSFVGKARFSFKPVEDGDVASTETAEKLLWGDLQANWPKMLVKMAAYRLMGFSVVEWVAEADENGLWRLTDLVPIPPWTVQSMQLDKNQRVSGVHQNSWAGRGEVMIPRAKCFYLVDDSNVYNPYGRGVLADCAQVALDILQLQELEQKGNVSNLRRKPNILAPLADLAKQLKNEDITQDQYNNMIQPLRDFILSEDTGPDLNMILESMSYPAMREGGAVETPSALRIWDTIYPDPVPTDLSGQGPIERKTTELARMLGIEALLLGNNSTGSFALAEVQADLFAAGVDGVLRDIAAELTRVLKILWIVNEGRLHPEAERHLAEKEAAEREKENAKEERLKAINGGGGAKGDAGGEAKGADKLSKAVEDSEARRVDPGGERDGPPNGDWGSLAPTVEADLAAFIDAGQMVELVRNIAGLGLTVNPDSNMVRDILDRAGLDADGAFQGLEEQHADQLEEMEARGFGEGPPDEGKPFGKSLVDFGRGVGVEKWVGVKPILETSKFITAGRKLANLISPKGKGGAHVGPKFPPEDLALKEAAQLGLSSKMYRRRLIDRDAGRPGGLLRSNVQHLLWGADQHIRRMNHLLKGPYSEAAKAAFRQAKRDAQGFKNRGWEAGAVPRAPQREF